MSRIVAQTLKGIQSNRTYNQRNKYTGINKSTKPWLILFAALIQPLNCNMTSSKNPCKIYLRHDQKASDIGAHENLDVGIYAPKWVKDGLQQLAHQLQGTQFAVFEFRRGKDTQSIQSFSISSKMTLADLQKISRNEQLNVSGEINWSLYFDGGVNDAKVLLAMKDLVRQSIIVGRDIATHYGGYPDYSSRMELKSIPVYICDLAALQFQQEYNTGRLVLIHTTEKESSAPIIGLLDDFIFENVVGEKRKSYQEAKAEGGDRYIETEGFNNAPCLFDVYAYHKFIIGDVILAGRAIAEIASKHGDKVVFKFLKYGTGFFAGEFGSETSRNILRGVISGLEILFSEHADKVLGVIKHVEFPFYKGDSESMARLEVIKEKYGVSYSFSFDDALQPTQEGLVVATTNCGDSMAVMGNEMGFSSVDAAIAENLKSKGAIFCPLLNTKINTIFLD